MLPALSVLALMYPLWAVAAGEDAPGQAYRSHWVPVAVLAWVLVGAAVYVCLRRASRRALAALGTALADGPEFADSRRTA